MKREEDNKRLNGVLLLLHAEGEQEEERKGPAAVGVPVGKEEGGEGEESVKAVRRERERHERTVCDTRRSQSLYLIYLFRPLL